MAHKVQDCVYVGSICTISIVYNQFIMCGTVKLQLLSTLSSSFGQHLHSVWLQLHPFDMKKKESDA